MIQVLIYENGSVDNGKVIRVERCGSIEGILAGIQVAFNQAEYARLFTSKGKQITSANQLTDGEMIFVSNGEDFISPWLSDEKGQLVKLSSGHVFSSTHQSTLDPNEPGTSGRARASFPYSQDVIVDRTPTHGKINHMTDKVMEVIFGWLEVADLKDCRLVSTKWNRISSLVCRGRLTRLARPKYLVDQRRTKYNKSNPIPPVSALFKIFTHRTHLPWSAYVSYDADAYASLFSVETEFVDTFGLALLEVVFSRRNFPTMFSILQRTLNLCSIDICLDHNHQWPSTSKEIDALGQVSLPKLQRVKVSLERKYNVERNGLVPFLEHVLQNTEDHLTLLTIFGLDFTGLTIDSARRLTSLLNKFKFVSIPLPHITPAAFSAFTAQYLRIHELQLHLEEPRNVDGNHRQYFHPQENFLSTSSTHLETLDLILHLDSGECGIPLNFPINGFPRLQEISLQFLKKVTDTKGTHAFSQTLLKRLNSKHLPVLKKVSIGSNEGYEDIAKDDISFFNCCPSTSFPSVTELYLGCITTFVLNDDWSRVFPNLKKLTTTVLNTRRSFERLFANQSLEHLDLIIVMLKGSGEGFVDDVNALLSVRITSKELRDHSQFPESEGEMKKYRDLSYLPSLFQLSKLKAFHLGFEFQEESGDSDASSNPDSDSEEEQSEREIEVEVCNVRLCDTLLMLHPLNSLVLHCVAISEECEAKLRARHQSLTVNPCHCLQRRFSYPHKSTSDSCKPGTFVIKRIGTRSSCRDVVAWNEPAHGQINELSEEVLEIIFSALDVADLKDCRLVNSKWNRISSAVGRRRLTFVGKPSRYQRRTKTKYGTSATLPPASDIFKVLTEGRELLWSAYSSHNQMNSIDSFLNVESEFIRIFGPALFHVNFIDRSFNAVFSILYGTPNLRSINIILPADHAWPSTEEDIDALGQLTLPTLKQVKVEMGMGNPVETNGSIPFLEHLLKNREGRLASLKMSELDLTELSMDSAWRLTSLLEKFFFVSIQLPYNTSPPVFNVFKARDINVHKLKLGLQEPNNVNRNYRAYFQPQEKFLSASSSHLESLTIVGRVNSGRCGIPFNFPSNGFRKLKKLSLNFDGDGSAEWNWNNTFSKSLFQRLESRHCPVLKKVSIGNFEDELDEYPWTDAVEDEFSLFNCCSMATFPSVTELKLKRINTFKLKDDWSRVFPNLTKLTTTILNTRRSFERILLNKNLEQLDLCVVLLEGGGFEENPNVLLSIRVTPEDQDHHLTVLDSAEEVGKYRNQLYFPSLFQLTKLKVLRLGFDFREEWEDSDAGEPIDQHHNICHSRLCDLLLMLQPLNSLVLYGVEITPVCEAKLSRRHQNLKIN